MEPESAVRATVETVAENIVDAVVAPLFYAFSGWCTWPCLSCRQYPCSMLGYKNRRYIHFGLAAAVLTDVSYMLRPV